MNKKIVIWLVVAAVALGGGYLLFRDATSPEPILITSSGVWFRAGDVVKLNPSTLGIDVSATNFIPRTMPMNSASTTACALQVPETSTTTARLSINIATASTTQDATFHLALSDTAFETTTPIGQITVPAGDGDIAIASTTEMIISPGKWFVVGITGGNGTFSPNGRCDGLFSRL